MIDRVVKTSTRVADAIPEAVRSSQSPLAASRVWLTPSASTSATAAAGARARAWAASAITASAGR